METWREELYHHGILGQRWGRKNGPPYPLDASDHSAAEKKAGYKKSIGGGRNEELYDRKKISLLDLKAKHIKSDAEAFRRNYERYEKNMQRNISKRRQKADKYAAAHNGKRSKFLDSYVKEAQDALDSERKTGKMLDDRATKAQKEAQEYKDKKAIKQEMKKNTFGEHYTKAGREVHEEITKTNEYKKMEEYHNQLQEAYNQLQKEHPGAQLLVPKDYKQEYVKRQHELNLKANEIISKNTSKLASAKLKDLNIEETAKTRAYIEKLMSQQYEDDRKKEEKRYKAELKK